MPAAAWPGMVHWRSNIPAWTGTKYHLASPPGLDVDLADVALTYTSSILPAPRTCAVTDNGWPGRKLAPRGPGQIYDHAARRTDGAHRRCRGRRDAARPGGGLRRLGTDRCRNRNQRRCGGGRHYHSVAGPPIAVACAVIGGVACLLSTAGVLLGGACGVLIGRRAEIVGGVVLIGLGCKILMEHVFFDGG